MAAVRVHIPNGDTIACAVPAHHLIAAGVSNWGGYGLAAAAAVLSTRRANAGALDDDDAGDGSVGAVDPRAVATVEEEASLSAAVVSSGARDGITCALDGSVDGMPLAVHLALLAEIRAVLERVSTL